MTRGYGKALDINHVGGGAGGCGQQSGECKVQGVGVANAARMRVGTADNAREGGP